MTRTIPIQHTDRKATTGRPAPRPTGFTLIELLVVISIIALLIGILLPALGRARIEAQASMSSSNIRQLGIANQTYATDHAGYYVPGAANFLANLDRWHGGRTSDTEPFEAERGPLWDYLRTERIRACPQFEGYLEGFEAGSGGYGYNNEYVGRDDGDPLTTTLGAKQDWFIKPTETIMFTTTAFSMADASGPSLIEYSFTEPPQYIWGPATPSIHFRYHDTAIVVWLDGHVSRETMTFTRGNPWFGVTEEQQRELGLGWFGEDDNSLFDRR